MSEWLMRERMRAIIEKIKRNGGSIQDAVSATGWSRCMVKKFWSKYGSLKDGCLKNAGRDEIENLGKRAIELYRGGRRPMAIAEELQIATATAKRLSGACEVVYSRPLNGDAAFQMKVWKKLNAYQGADSGFNVTWINRGGGGERW